MLEFLIFAPIVAVVWMIGIAIIAGMVMFILRLFVETK